MKGIQIITDKNHEQLRRPIYPAERIPAAVQLQAAEQASSGFLGFGVAITGASCHELSLMEPAERRALLEKIYSREGLGLSVARLSIGSSDYSAELYSYDDTPFDTALTHFSIERDTAYIIPMIREILEINPDLYIFASPWSPPGWMKTGGLLCGGFMRDQYVDCYADYFVKYIKAYGEYGIKISAVTPQNECMTEQRGRMPACIWHPETEAAFAKALKRKLQENALDVEIWMLDHNFHYADRLIWQLENIEGLEACCDGAAFHYYHRNIEETLPLQKAFPRLPLHFTEGGPRLYDHYADDWCKWGGQMIKALGQGYRSFTGWNLMLNEMGGPNIGPFWCGGLVTRDAATGALSFSGQFKAFGHLAPYINKDSELRALRPDESFGQDFSCYPKQIQAPLGLAIDNHDGKLIAVLTNPNEEKLQTQFTLGGVQWYAELLPESISTIILE